MARKYRRPGVGGGMPNMKNLQKQMQQMQEELEKAQEELATQEITASAGGGVVEARVNGNKDLLGIKIDPDILDPEDVEMIEDMVVAAVNEAFRQVDAVSDEKLGKFTQGMNIPGF